MLILAIETTGPHCSAALLDNNNEITELSSDEVLNHLQTLTPMIDELLKMSGRRIEELDQIAVSVGPGSFTGIRIGVSTGRALSQITGIRLTAVPTLFAFGWGVSEDGEARQAGQIVCPVFDARRNQVYAGAYIGSDEIIAGGPYMLEEFLDKLENLVMQGGQDEAGGGADAAAADRRPSGSITEIKFVGDGLKPYGGRIAEWAAEKNIKIERELVFQTAGNVAEFASFMLADPETFAGEINLGYDQLKPNYMRISEAEKKLQEKKEKRRKED